MMKKIFNYYYYRVYSHFQSGDTVPFFSTYVLILSFIYINSLTAVGLIVDIWLNIPVKLAVFVGSSILTPVVIILLGYCLFYYFFVKREYHYRIINSIKPETRNQEKIGKFFVALYFILSLVMFIVMLWLKDQLRGR